MSTRGPHDIGGLPAGPIDPSHHDEADWEKMATALSAAIGTRGRGLICVDERRRATEDLGDDYHRLAYFEKSIQATANLMVEKSILTKGEISRRMAEIKARRAGDV